MSQRKEMLMKNMEFVAYEGLNGKPGFQMTLHKSKEGRYYLYVACFRHNGFNIISSYGPPCNYAFGACRHCGHYVCINIFVSQVSV